MLYEQVKEFLESAAQGTTGTHELLTPRGFVVWVQNTARELLKEGGPKLKFCKYLDIRTRMTEEWALDQARNVMVRKDGQYWGFGGENGFLDCHELVFDDPPAKTLRFHEYYNRISGERSRWARDEENQVMVDTYGHTWNLYGEGSFFTSGWVNAATLPPYSFPGPGQQLDIDALKRQVTALERKLSWKDTAVLSKLEQRVEALEASSKLETVRLSDLARKVDWLENELARVELGVVA